ncbi:hypothetical protein GU927_008150 [Rhodobacteraceae bacterium HSP-20]|uniref:Uncharacterized protein n=1 Tax=Paragemmobacter amnigenus TaxID=2852097 RepID=A0ABS6J2I8_9RHOB|nr:hypothetical protein [Rhodobacter amnigenus]MBU9697818.1 hypothetical protein [Rhodobacter amnigenus]MBV4389045.1 hypothetical protein [Rhodobacter amnigenus]
MSNALNNRQPSNTLTYEDAIQIHLRHRAGEFQNRIAASFDVNPGRVNEVVKGKRFPEALSDPRLA